MTRKDKTDKSSTNAENVMKSEKEHSNEESVSQKSSDVSVSEKKKSSEQSAEIKQISGKEPGKLEYYSKEHLIERLSNSDAELKKQSEDLKKTKEEAENWNNKYMRLQAEFENAQKRWDKTRKNLRLEYTASVLKSFLPLYDSFKKALSDDKENTKLLKGFFDQFMSILKSYKAEPMKVEENETYDYTTQEALTSIEKTDVPKNTILEVVQDGWKLDNEVLRYAKVIISKEPKPPEPKPEPKAEIEALEQEQTNQTENAESKDSTEKGADDIKSTNSNKEGNIPED